MELLKVWKNNSGKGTIIYHDQNMAHEIFDAMTKVTGTVCVLCATWDMASKIRQSYPTLNATVATDAKTILALNIHVMVLFNVNDFSAFARELAVNKKAKYWLNLVDCIVPAVSDQLKYNSDARFKVLNKPNLVLTREAIYKKFINLDGEAANHFEKLTETITENRASFKNHEEMLACLTGRDGQSPADVRYQVALDRGWSPNMDTSIPMFKRISEIYQPEAIHDRAKLTISLAAERDDLLSDNEAIADAIVDIQSKYPDKRILVFNKNGRMGDRIEHKLPRVSCSVHTLMAKKPVRDENTNEFVRYKSGKEKGAIKYFGSTVLTDLAIKAFNNGEIKVLLATYGLSNDYKIVNPDIIIITSIKLSNWFAIQEKFKLHCGNILYVLINSEQQVNAFNNEHKHVLVHDYNDNFTF